MILREFSLKNFRNLDGVFHCIAGINAFIAPNGSGKTNLLESVGFLSRGKSFRTVDELTTINKNILLQETLPFARLSGDVEDGLGNSLSREIILEKVNGAIAATCRKTLKIDGNKTILAKFINDFASVIFSPNTIDIVTGSPQIRRKDLDTFLIMYDEEYYRELTDYNKVIRGRNKILEKIQTRKGTIRELSFWNEQLTNLGSRIIHKRVQSLNRSNPIIAQHAHSLFNGDLNELEVNYESKFLTRGNDIGLVRDELDLKIRENIQKEIFAGRSLYGPHREDFQFFLNGYGLREYGSRGQQRLCSFLYKIAQHDMLEKKHGVAPLLLIDDLFSELDHQVRERIQRFLQELKSQILLTGLDKNEFEKEFLENVNLQMI